MTQATNGIRSNERCVEDAWPARTRNVSRIGTACVIQGTGDFDLDDLNLVRHRFPNRRVTLDGDVITVWPTPPPTREEDSPNRQPWPGEPAPHPATGHAPSRPQTTHPKAHP
ncbi:hypothetical protein QFZ76_000096 [Streptomyces sp. V4I2]|nr:hypothetical protein [Streptomyces sp. V4I2]